jgi:hypothetical protein
MRQFRYLLVLAFLFVLAGCSTPAPPLGEMGKADLISSSHTSRVSKAERQIITVVRNDLVSVAVDVRIDGELVGKFDKPFQRLDIPLSEGEYLISVEQIKGGWLAPAEALRAKAVIRVPTKFPILRVRIDQTGFFIKYVIEQDAQ